jgi:hypothetical protein
MARETAELKARRYLAEARLTILQVGPGVVRAICRGDGRVYRLGWWKGRWGCSCPAGQFRSTCAHLRALRLVVVEPESAHLRQSA